MNSNVCIQLNRLPIFHFSLCLMMTGIYKYFLICPGLEFLVCDESLFFGGDVTNKLECLHTIESLAIFSPKYVSHDDWHI